MHVTNIDLKLSLDNESKETEEVKTYRGMRHVARTTSKRTENKVKLQRGKSVRGSKESTLLRSKQNGRPNKNQKEICKAIAPMARRQNQIRKNPDERIRIKNKKNSGRWDTPEKNKDPSKITHQPRRSRRSKKRKRPAANKTDKTRHNKKRRRKTRRPARTKSKRRTRKKIANNILQKGLSKSVKQARQFIIHGHASMKGKKVDVPSYIVPAKTKAQYHSTIVTS